MHNKLVDVRALVRNRYKGWVPGVVLGLLEKLVRQDELNRLMQLQDYVDGVDMSNRLLEALSLSVTLVGKERLPSPDERVIFACNHPLGGADGIVLTAVLGNLYRKKFHVMVTDLLMQVWQMSDVFVPINQYGSQSRNSQKSLAEALEGDAQVLTFPSGAVSRVSESGRIEDREWRPSFAKLARRYERDIVPLFFEGQNSKSFYRTEQIRSALGIKFNIGTVLLPKEFLGAKGKHFKIYVGERVPFSEVPVGSDVKSFASELHDLIYTFPRLYEGEKAESFRPVIQGR